MNEKCPYCEADDNHFVLINTETNIYSGLSIAINRQGMLRVRFKYGDCDNFESQDIINIKYCPMCKRKLR